LMSIIDLYGLIYFALNNIETFEIQYINDAFRCMLGMFFDFV